MTATRRLQKLVHVGCRELGIDSDTRRDLQLVVTGKDSLANMTEDELGNVVAALVAKGFRPSGGGKRPPAARADVRYAHVLWRLLAQGGHVRKSGAAGLNAFIRSRFGQTWGAEPIDIDTLRDSKQINDVIRALKDWCQREGIETEG